MGKQKHIKKVIPEIVTEKTMDFKREKDGTYRMIRNKIKRDLTTGKILSVSDTLSDDTFEMTDEEEFDHEFTIQDENGNDRSLRFKKIQTEKEKDDE